MSNSFSVYSDKKREVIRTLKELGKLIKESNPSSYSEIIKLTENIHRDSIKLLILGEFKSGKSTLVNAMIGKEILPAWNWETSAAIVEVKAGGEDKVSMVDADGIKDISQEEFEKLATTENVEYDEIDRFIVTVPDGRYLPRGAFVVDTPGTNSADLGRQSVTMRYLPNMDAAVFVMNIDRVYTENEKNFLIEEILPYSRNNIFIVINKCEEQIEDGSIAHIAEEIRKRIKEDCGVERIYCVSAMNALYGISDSDEELLENSNFPLLMSELGDFISASKDEIVFEKALSRGCRIADDILSDIDFKKNALNLDRAELDSRIRATEPVLNELIRDIDIIRQNISGMLRQASDDMDAKLQDMKGESLEKLRVQYKGDVSNQNFDSVMNRVAGESREWTRALNAYWKRQQDAVKQGVMEYLRHLDMAITDIKGQVSGLGGGEIVAASADINPDKVLQTEIDEEVTYEPSGASDYGADDFSAICLGGIFGCLLLGPIGGIIGAFLGASSAGGGGGGGGMRRVVNKIVKKKVNVLPALEAYNNGIRENMRRVIKEAEKELVEFVSTHTKGKVSETRNIFENMKKRAEDLETGREGLRGLIESEERIKEKRRELLEYI